MKIHTHTHRYVSWDTLKNTYRWITLNELLGREVDQLEQPFCEVLNNWYFTSFVTQKLYLSFGDETKCGSGANFKWKTPSTLPHLPTVPSCCIFLHLARPPMLLSICSSPLGGYLGNFHKDITDPAKPVLHPPSLTNLVAVKLILSLIRCN